jgi:hypothetical protein
MNARTLLATVLTGLTAMVMAATMAATPAAAAEATPLVDMNSGCDNHPGVPDWFYTALGNAAEVTGDGVPSSWGSGDQAWAMMKIICNESSFEVTAHNPAGYYGLGQMGRTQIADARVSFNCYWNADSGCAHLRRWYQCLAALRYANQRYDTPLKAWDFWKAHHWW